MHLELLSRSATDACRDTEGGIVAHIGESTVIITLAENREGTQYYNYVVKMDSLTIRGRLSCSRENATNYVGILRECVAFMIICAGHCTYAVGQNAREYIEPIDVWSFAHATELQQLADALTRKVVADDRPDKPRASEWLHIREE